MAGGLYSAKVSLTKDRHRLGWIVRSKLDRAESPGMLVQSRPSYQLLTRVTGLLTIQPTG